MRFMMNFKYLIPVVIILRIASLNLFSQQLPDLSNPGASFISMIDPNLKEENEFNGNFQVSIIVKLHAFCSPADPFCEDSLALFKVIMDVNDYFAKTGITFFHDKLEVLPHTGFSTIRDTQTIEQVHAMFSELNKINVFLVNAIELDSIQGCGLSFFPDKPDKNLIILKKSYFTPVDLARMLGHFLGLLSTHDTRGGIEMVAGDNCTIAGDFLCDTYADGNMLNLVDDQCEYVGSQGDPRGQAFVPSVANIMSEAPSQCRCIFTEGQIRRMKYYYLKYRTYLRQK